MVVDGLLGYYLQRESFALASSKSCRRAMVTVGVQVIARRPSDVVRAISRMLYLLHLMTFAARPVQQSRVRAVLLSTPADSLHCIDQLLRQYHCIIVSQHVPRTPEEVSIGSVRPQTVVFTRQRRVIGLPRLHASFYIILPYAAWNASQLLFCSHLWPHEHPRSPS